MIVEKNRNLSKLIQSLLTLLAQKPKDDTHGHGQKSYFGQNAHPYINIIEWIHKFLMFGRTMFVQFVSCTETCFELIRFLFVFAKSHNFGSFVLMSDFLHSSSGCSLRTAVLIFQ